MWKLANTWPRPGQGANAARGMPAPGAGAQFSGARPLTRGGGTIREPLRPTIGLRSWFAPGSPPGPAQGFPAPENAAQRRPAGSMPNHPIQYGRAIPVWTPPYSRGADAVVMNYGKLLTNPIGAGVVAQFRPHPYYGQPAQYDNGALWWTSQIIPTSINLAGLTDPESLEALVGSVNVEAMVRTTG